LRSICIHPKGPCHHSTIPTGPFFRGFTETDAPNFSFRSPPCSFYSGTKALGVEAIAEIFYSWFGAERHFPEPEQSKRELIVANILSGNHLNRLPGIEVSSVGLFYTSIFSSLSAFFEETGAIALHEGVSVSGRFTERKLDPLLESLAICVG
jgi:hypothetical protein